MTYFRYSDRGTPIHRLGPYCKLAWGLGVLVLALIMDHPLFLLLLFASTLPMVIAAGVGKQWLSSMKLVLYISLAIIVINVLLNYNGDTVLWQAPFRIPQMGQPAVTLEAIIFGAVMSLRLASIVSATAIVTLTVHPDDLMQAMIKMRLPYKSVLVTSLSTRFMPTLIDDARRITDAQRSRGLEMDRGGLYRRMRGRMSIIIPLLSNSLDRTVQVAEAMDSRAYGNGSGRTYYRELGMGAFAVAGLIAALLPLAFGIYVRIGGYASYQYYPTLDTINLSAGGWASLAVLAVLLCAIVPLAFLQRRSELD